jgi:hypothetical protein
MISFTHKGDLSITTKFLLNAKNRSPIDILRKYGRAGVTALAAATPVDSGKTASSWDYSISDNGKNYKITWSNSNVNDGSLIAILIQYGHGTRNGGYVQGTDYINPAIRPIFDNIAEAAWREVING